MGSKNQRTSNGGLDFGCFESVWQERWEREGIYKVDEAGRKEKKYILVEFPYPSGSGLHVGHAFTMTGADVYARKARMSGKNVLFPIGWDAFGLPTENYAIKTGQKPQKVTKDNTNNFRRQMKQMAFSFDWDREINTSDPNYYRWTQWIFIQLFKKGLTYKKSMPINWCPDCKIGLANEEVVNGNCERCGAPVSRRKLNQWIVKITNYADRLINGLDKTDFVDKVKKAQVNWIGKSLGARVKFSIPDFSKSGSDYIEIFTTRPDTIFGATFMVLAPEHPLVEKITDSQNRVIGKSQIQKIKEYVDRARKKSDLERTDLAKEKTGVFTGLYAINPASNNKIPVWISDFVLESYGTGAIMAVPAHDDRDWHFAQKFDLPIVPVIEPEEGWDFGREAYINTGHGKIINSGFINGLVPSEAIEKMIVWLEERGIGCRATSYHLRDWIFSRQRYWGEPIPMAYCAKCAAKHSGIERRKADLGELKKYAVREGIDINVLLDNPGWFPVDERELPVELPEVDKYEPTDNGESPLANINSWKATKCPCCGGPATRETDTMPNWAGSDWYYLAYCFAKSLRNGNFIEEDIFSFSKDALNYWLPVDVYIGGDEHNTLHLLYSRFIYQFLFDLGVMPRSYLEPYYRRISHGVILGPDGQRMSKSQKNIISPDDKWQKYGVDTLRTYLMFMGPFEETMAWNENAFKGTERFLVRFKNLINDQSMVNGKTNQAAKSLVNRLILKVSDDIDKLSFNTAIAAMMKTVNTINNQNLVLDQEDCCSLVKILAPFAPYLAEELWCRVLGQSFSVHQRDFPRAKKEYLMTEKTTIIVQINGRLKGKIDIKSITSKDKDRVILLAKEELSGKNQLSGQKIKKTVFVPGKLVNFVI